MTLDIRTRLLHPVETPARGGRSVPTVLPVHLAATYDQESPTEFGEFDYARSGNPTRQLLESQIADLEGAAHAFAYASGLAAITAVTRLLRPGDEILAAIDLYGGTQRLFSSILNERGIRTVYADPTEPASFLAAGGPRTRLVFVEGASNPLLQICDLRAISAGAHERGALLAVDNTLLTPLNLRPIDLGADVVIQSATKYLSGHSDVTGGTVATSSDELADQLYKIQNGEGSPLAPFDCYLLERGLKTLALRLERQQENALKVGEHLAGRTDITGVRYPLLRGHPGRELLKRQSLPGAGGGCVVSFETGSVERSAQLVSALKLFSIRVSFGVVSSSASLPFFMSHASVPAKEKRERNLPRDLVRLSVGIEHVDDLIADLDRALEQVALRETIRGEVCR
jgi:cystathionine beta-lyase